MSQRLRYIVSIVLLTGLLVHFLLVVLSLQSTPTKSSAVAQAYTEPFFHQNWKLFVPPPTCNYRVYVRSKSAKGWTSWSDKLHDLTMAHRKNRLAGNELPLLALSNSLYYLDATLPNHDTVYTKPPADPVFRVFEHCLTSLIDSADTSYEVLLSKQGTNQTTIYYFKDLR